MVRKYTYLELYLNDLNKSISLREFEHHFKKPHQTMKAHLKEFVDSKILLLEKKARFVFYSLNLKNPLLKQYLSMCEKERLFAFLEKNSLFRRLYDHLSIYNDTLMIFGSAVHKKDFSDIDLLIVSDNKKIRKTIQDFINTYNIKIHVIQTNEKSLTNSFITELKKNHIILNNHDYFIGRLYQNELGMV
jgi:predicted nucleotidyltransferase